MGIRRHIKNDLELAEKIVRFNHEDTRVQEIPSLDEFSDEEFDSLWLSPEEFGWIKRRERKLLRRLKYVGNVGPTDDALGLESNAERREKLHLIENAKTCVFGEQKRQLKKKDHDPERIALLYSRSTEECSTRALERAVIIRSQLLEGGGVKPCRRFSADMGEERMRRTSQIWSESIKSPCHHRWSISFTGRDDMLTNDSSSSSRRRSDCLLPFPKRPSPTTPNNNKNKNNETRSSSTTTTSSSNKKKDQMVMVGGTNFEKLSKMIENPII